MITTMIVFVLDTLEQNGSKDEARAINARKTQSAQIDEMRDTVRRLAWCLSRKGIRHTTRIKMIRSMYACDKALQEAERKEGSNG